VVSLPSSNFTREKKKGRRRLDSLIRRREKKGLTSFLDRVERKKRGGTSLFVFFASKGKHQGEKNFSRPFSRDRLRGGGGREGSACRLRRRRRCTSEKRGGALRRPRQKGQIFSILRGRPEKNRHQRGGRSQFFKAGKKTSPENLLSRGGRRAPRASSLRTPGERGKKPVYSIAPS